MLLTGYQTDHHNPTSTDENAGADPNAFPRRTPPIGQ